MSHDSKAQPCILVVDGHPGLRSALPPWICSLFPHCRVITARTGLAGVSAARRHAPHIVVLEVRLPALNGMETARRIKRHAPETAIVMFTFCEGESYRTEARRAGACGYVLKHEAAKELPPMLGAVLERTNPRRPSSGPANSGTKAQRYRQETAE